MADGKPIATGRALRIVYYLIAAICVFFIFLLAVTSSQDHFDPGLILTMIIAVLLLSFMLFTSSQLAAIKAQLDELQSKK